MSEKILYVNFYGSKVWHKDGKAHRDDGPAIIYRDGLKRWYHNGRRLQETTTR
jgi:hypothetical protein